MAQERSERNAAGQGDIYLAGTYADVRKLPRSLQQRVQVRDRGEANCPPDLLEELMAAFTGVGLPVRAIGYVRDDNGRTQSGDYASYEGFSVQESLRWVRAGLEHVRPNDSCYIVWWTSEDLARQRSGSE